MSLHITVLERQAHPLPQPSPPVVIEESGCIGRGPENDLILLDDPAISRHHAKIRLVDTHYVYEDLSTNGSLSIKDNLLIHQRSITISDGMQMKLGQYLLSFALIEGEKRKETDLDNDAPFHPFPSPDPIGNTHPNTTPPGWESKGGAHHLDLIFKAAGLPVCHPEDPAMAAMTAERIGKLLKAYTQGLKKALDARATVKDELHAARTLLGARDNNPLKFIHQDTDSLQELVLGTESSYRSAELAIEEAFNDLIAHEMALFAAIQLSAKHVIRRFSPKEIESSVGGGIGFQRKMKCWDAYSDSFPQMAETALDDLLGKNFLQAYEEQILKIKAMP